MPMAHGTGSVDQRLRAVEGMEGAAQPENSHDGFLRLAWEKQGCLGPCGCGRESLSSLSSASRLLEMPALLPCFSLCRPDPAARH